MFIITKHTHVAVAIIGNGDNNNKATIIKEWVPMCVRWHLREVVCRM